ncbi:MAG: DUF5666 domain-containing protein, partial [Burkholderiales bacterium]
MDSDRVSSGRRALRGLAAWLVVLLVMACGGGVGTGGTGAFASGPITGFGSIIVEGVHFDESAARIEGDDDAGRDRSELRLGTMVEVQSSEIRDGAAAASQVRIVSALIGSVDSVAADALVVNGQTVRVNAGTVFDDRFAGGIAAITVGRVVEVYGFVSAAPAEIVATRIEPKDGATAFKFRGVVAALNTQARTFDVGNQHFVYAASVSGASDLRDGAFLRVMLGVQRDAQGRWVVSALGATGPEGGDRDQAKARGVITAFTSNANFAVGGFTVDASAAQIEGGPLAAGLQVEVEGRLQAGVLIATSVDVENSDQPDELELRGTIATIDTAAKVFTISGRSERVSYARNDIVY